MGLKRIEENHGSEGLLIPKTGSKNQGSEEGTKVSYLEGYMISLYSQILEDVEKTLNTQTFSRIFFHTWSRYGREKRPFAHLYYWAAFTFTGA